MLAIIRRKTNEISHLSDGQHPDRFERRNKDVKQTVVEASRLTLYEIVYQSLFTDKLSLRARSKEIAARLKQDNI